MHLENNFWEGILEQMTERMHSGKKVEYYHNGFKFVLIFIPPEGMH